MRFLIETYSIHRLQYVVEAESYDEAREAFDQKSDEMTELDQDHLDENIFNVWEISDEEFRMLCERGCNGHLGEKVVYRCGS